MSIQTVKETLQKSTAHEKRVVVLGSTGTIGRNTLKLIEASDTHRVEVLTGGANVQLLAEQAKAFTPRLAVIQDESKYAELKTLLEGTGIEVAAGAQAVVDAAGTDADVVISGIVGAAALSPTLAAIRKGRVIGLANKECLVCAGDLMNIEITKHGATILPVDSEHNAVYQALCGQKLEAIERITLTASGGPFRKLSAEQLEKVTVAEALRHPNWNMGAKISVDSATMMNKGLEVIEAYHLFPVKIDQIDVLVHPESIVHCLVSYTDGSTLAGLSVPDMCVPISYALAWPERMQTATPRLDLAKLGALHFEAPDEIRFPALKLARQALQIGGTAPTILNAANEVAVAAFLEGRIGFTAITTVVERTLNQLPHTPAQSVEDVLAADASARRKALEAL